MISALTRVEISCEMLFSQAVDLENTVRVSNWRKEDPLPKVPLA